MERRDFIRMALGAAAVAIPGRAQALDLPLGFMLHALRVKAAVDFPGTLRQAAQAGYAEVEVVSFPGYSSPTPRDGFAALASMPPAAIRAAIADAGLTVSSGHFKFEQFEAARLAESIAWARGVGLEYMTMADVPIPKTRAEWPALFTTINTLGSRLRQDGLQLALHTQAGIWSATDGTVFVDALMEQVQPDRLQLQLDLSSSQSARVDPVPYLERYRGRFFSLHLRDAKTPPPGGGYVFSVPLGQGDLDMPRIVRAARAGGVRKFIVEMQTQAPLDPIDAMRQSAQYLRALD